MPNRVGTVIMKRRPTPPSQWAKPGPGRAVDLFIAIAQGIFVFALATALNLHFGLDLNIAMALAAVVYAGLLGRHALRQRRQAANVRREFAPSFEGFEAVHDRLSGVTPPPIPAARGARPLEAPAAMRPRAKVAQVSLPPLTDHSVNPRRPAGPAAPARPAARTAAAGQPVKVQPHIPPVVPIAAGTVVAGAGGLESDVERIQALVKKLANEINENDFADGGPQAPIYGKPPRLSADARADASVGALRQTAEGMKAASSNSLSDLGAVLAANAAPPPIGQSQSYIATVADSLVAGRVEVELEPILSLVDQRTTHYEVSVNVHGPGGDRLVENSDFVRLQGSGLLPLFDSARMNRSVTIAQRLLERGKHGRVFSAYSVESLTNPSFLSDVRNALHERGHISAQLVFGFPQADIRAFTPAEWAAIAELRQMHVVFGIDRMTHIDQDLKQLVAAGFTFARIEATQFLSGLRFAGGTAVGSDLTRYITGAGLTLIVDNVGSEQQLLRLGQSGVQLGQGRVFGGRRPVKLTSGKASHAAA
jgi:cyclic-di-GMP phosphodiesterase TipF (flagellum assembly factor)